LKKEAAIENIIIDSDLNEAASIFICIRVQC